MIKIRDGFKGERALSVPLAVLRQMQKDPYCRQLYLTHVGYFPSAQYHYRKRDRGTVDYVLLCCVRGRGYVEVDGVRYEVLPNRAFLISALRPHIYYAADADPWTIHWMHFRGEMVASMELPADRPFIFTALDNTQASGIVTLHEEILRTLQAGYSIENLQYATSCLFHFLGTIKYNNLRHNITHHQNAVIERTTRFLKENIDKTLTSRQIAEQLGYSYSHLSSLFAKSFACSPCTYFARIKMQKACHYLDFTELKVNQICYRVGIDDPYYFSRLFTRIMGLSPRAYRQQTKG